MRSWSSRRIPYISQKTLIKNKINVCLLVCPQQPLTDPIEDVCNVTNDALPDDALTLRLSHEVLVVEEDSVHLPEDSRQEQDQRTSFIQCPQ